MPTTLRCTSAIKADKVFTTPELLEQILLYLLPRELLELMPVNKAAARTVHGSPKLQDLLSLRPLPQGSLYSVFGCHFHHNSDCGVYCFDGVRVNCQ